MTPETHSSGKTVHRVNGEIVEAASGLAIYRYDGEDGYYLFGCDSEWKVMTDTWHATIEEALAHAEFEYPGIVNQWKTP